MATATRISWPCWSPMRNSPPPGPARAESQAALAELAEDSDFRQALAAAVDRVNAGLSAIERIRRFAIAAEPFTTENAMMTASLKIRRHKIRERYGGGAGRALSVT